MFSCASTAATIPYVDKSNKQVPGIVSFHKDKERYIRCEFCRKFSHIVKQHVSKPPAITTIQGTRFYSRTLTEHVQTRYHKECAKSYRMKSIEVKEAGPMEIAISKANKDQVGKLMIQVFADGKCLSLSAFSWPARYVASAASFAYDSMNGSSELIFIGAAEQTERFANGLMTAVKQALVSNIDDPNIILCKSSSIITDGTNVNSGQKGGLWTLFEKEAKEAGSEIPLKKIWCAVHRSELSWKSTAKSVPEVSDVFNVLSKISTHFHFSGLRTNDLKKVASDHYLRILNLPKIFEIRWTEFTLKLVRSVLVSWKALVIYFEQNKKNAECNGYLNYLTKLVNLQLIAFLADVLFVFSRLQKQLQSNELNLMSMNSYINSAIKIFSI